MLNNLSTSHQPPYSVFPHCQSISDLPLHQSLTYCRQNVRQHRLQPTFIVGYIPAFRKLHLRKTDEKQSPPLALRSILHSGSKLITEGFRNVLELTSQLALQRNQVRVPLSSTSVWKATPVVARVGEHMSDITQSTTTRSSLSSSVVTVAMGATRSP